MAKREHFVTKHIKIWPNTRIGKKTILSNIFSKNLTFNRKKSTKILTIRMTKGQKKAKSREIYNYLQDKRNLQVKNRKTYQKLCNSTRQGFAQELGIGFQVQNVEFGQKSLGSLSMRALQNILLWMNISKKSHFQTLRAICIFK